MITKFKLFELLGEDVFPEIGNYVIMDGAMISLFINNNIGQIVDIIKEIKNDLPYTSLVVKYDNIPVKIDYCFIDNCRIFHINQITYMSKDKEELETILQAAKYNL